MRIAFYPGSGVRLEDAAELSLRVERIGLDGLWIMEASHEPFAPLAIAALATTRIELRTAVAIAFARNPMIMAQQAHQLARASGGRFSLGLGTQVKAHIERRYSEVWDEHPAAKMAEYLEALRAIWKSWNDGAPLDFRGDYYCHRLMTPAFNPGPSGYSTPQVHLAAVGPGMTRVAAKLADGIVLHPMSSPQIVREQVLPQLRDRLSAGPFEVTCPVLVITGSTEDERNNSIAAVRRQLAFYGSTAAYRPILEAHDMGHLSDELRSLAREGRWEELPGHIDDRALSVFAVEAPPEDLVSTVIERYSGLLTEVGLYAPYNFSEETWTRLERV